MSHRQPYLTLDEVAGELGFSRDDVGDLVAHGELRTVQGTKGELVSRYQLDVYVGWLAGILEGLQAVKERRTHMFKVPPTFGLED